MKKIMMVLAMAVLIGSMSASSSQAAQKYQKSDTTAVLLSALPGVGEWYNSDFKGNFPIGECLLGYICPCVGVSSLVDAAAGDASNGKIRIDFWSGVSVE